jgi:hypothetical protein
VQDLRLVQEVEGLGDLVGYEADVRFLQHVLPDYRV